MVDERWKAVGEKGKREMQLKECCAARQSQSICAVSRAFREKMKVDRNHNVIFWKLFIRLPGIFVHFLHSARHGVIAGGVPARLLQAR